MASSPVEGSQHDRRELRPRGAHEREVDTVSLSDLGSTVESWLGRPAQDWIEVAVVLESQLGIDPSVALTVAPWIITAADRDRDEAGA